MGLFDGVFGKKKVKEEEPTDSRKRDAKKIGDATGFTPAEVPESGRLRPSAAAG